MKTNQTSKYAYVKFHTVLSCLFTPAEIVFILHMVDIDSLKKQGYLIEWTRSYYMARMGLTTYSFDKCIEKLMQMKLLSKANNAEGNKVYYSFDMDLYNRLLTILSASSDTYIMTDFCTKNFKLEKRAIDSITDEEINILKKLRRNKYISQDGEILLMHR